MGSTLSSEEPVVQEEIVNNQSRMSLEPESLQPKRLRNARVTILNEILREKAKLNNWEVKENNEILHEFLGTFIAKMKDKDPTFKALYQCNFYTGSFYSDLRVSKPDEFDLNLVLKLPFKSASVTYHPQVPSYAKYYVNDEKDISEKGLKKLFKNGYLIPEEVRKWIQGVVDKALKEYQPPRSIIKVRPSAAGPAQTIYLVKRNGGQIDIDLVPAIQCSFGLEPPGIDRRVYNKVHANKLQCFLIPKPYRPTKQAPINQCEQERLWRTHYPEAESAILHDKQCVKPVIKLLKLLRDKEKWKILASYYLKTIVLWMVLEKPTWKMDEIGDRFLEALKSLSDCVKNRKIRYFFSSRYNLLEKLTEQQADNIHNRLCYIIREIERDDTNLWNIFDCKPTFTI